MELLLGILYLVYDRSLGKNFWQINSLEARTWSKTIVNVLYYMPMTWYISEWGLKKQKTMQV